MEEEIDNSDIEDDEPAAVDPKPKKEERKDSEAGFNAVGRQWHQVTEQHVFFLSYTPCFLFFFSLFKKSGTTVESR